MGFIDEEQLKQQADGLIKSGYGRYLFDVVKKIRD
jgi:dTDP-glucose pyrophosphorylase